MCDFPKDHWPPLAPAIQHHAKLHPVIAGHAPRGPLKHFWGEASRYVGDDNPYSLFLALGIPFEVTQRAGQRWFHLPLRRRRQDGRRHAIHRHDFGGTAAIGPVPTRCGRFRSRCPSCSHGSENCCRSWARRPMSRAKRRSCAPGIRRRPPCCYGTSAEERQDLTSPPRRRSSRGQRRRTRRRLGRRRR